MAANSSAAVGSISSFSALSPSPSSSCVATGLPIPRRCPNGHIALQSSFICRTTHSSFFCGGDAAAALASVYEDGNGPAGGALGSQMNIFERAVRVVKSYANALISSAEDPEKLLNQTVFEVNEDLTKLRQPSTQVLASQRQLENKYKAAQQTADDWYRRTKLALEKGEEDLAREALKRRKDYKERRASFGKVICSSAEQRDESNTQRKEIDQLHFSPITSRSGSISLLQCIEKVSNGLLQPLQLVKDTVWSIIFIFLVGILLFMDFAELFRSGQILNFHMNKSVTAAYTFLFLLSAVITALLGCMCIPFLRKLKAYQILRKEGPSTHVSKAGTPTMGGLYFIPVGVIVATVAARTSSAQISGLVLATLVFGAIGLLDDILGLIKKHNYGLPWWCKLLLEVIAGIGFFYWHQSICVPTPIQV